jgi:uncharacterized membrane protein YgcG
MKKKVLQIFILLFALALMLAFIQIFHFGGITGFVVSGDDLAKIDPEIIETFDNKDQVEVIIGLKNNNLDNKDFEVNEVTKKELIKLVKKEEVKYIEQVREFNIALTDATGITNITSVWPLQFTDINLTGTSETICIIDTGAEYTHPNLIGKNRTQCNLNCIDQTCVEDCNITDLNGHGTHVSGIATASGSINGLSPGSGFIALKVFPDSSGGGATTTGIKNAMDWCVSNSDSYNISVISMSIGTLTVYDDYCDSSFPSFQSSTNAATSKNISVVASTGNSGSGIERSSTSISSPGCIQNITPISATNKDDTIASYGHYSGFTKLFAPGSSITSTCIPDTSCSKSGTSMAAPVASGIISIINQVLKLTSQTNTTQDIESILYTTGLPIISASGNFSRINAYQAVLALDNIAPIITLTSPINNLLNLNQTQTLSCNISDWQLANITFQLWNSQGTLTNSTTLAILGQSSNISSLTLNNLGFDTYNWNCLVQDRNGNSNSATTNFTLTVGGISTFLNSPLTNTFSNTITQTYSCNTQSETDHEILSVTHNIWYSNNTLANSSTLDLSTSDTTNHNTSFINSFPQEGTYSWNCLSTNNDSSTSIATSNNTLTYDATSPAISLLSPADDISYTSDSQSIKFQFSATDTNTLDCDLYINSALSQTVIDITSSDTKSITKSLSPGNHTWHITCKDSASNSKSTLQRSLSITSESSSSGGGGGGGGGGSGGGEESSESPSSSSNTNTDTTPSFPKETKQSTPEQTPEESEAEFVTTDTPEQDTESELSPESSPGITGRAVGQFVGNTITRTVGTFLTIIVILFGSLILYFKRKIKKTKIPEKKLKHGLK